MEVSKKKKNQKNSLSGSEVGKARRSRIHCGRASAVNILGLDDSGSVWKNSDI